MLGGPGDDVIDGRSGDDLIIVVGDDQDNDLVGFGGADIIDGARGDDLIDGQGDSDQLAGGEGNDSFLVRGHPFDGVDVSAPGRQIVGFEDFISDYEFRVADENGNLVGDVFAFDAKDFAIPGDVSFVALDGNDPTAVIPDAANVIVLLDSDNDDDPTTPFLAGTAATQIAGLRAAPGPGFFVYFNSNLQLNRLVYSTDLSDASADLKIINRLTDRGRYDNQQVSVIARGL